MFQEQRRTQFVRQSVSLNPMFYLYTSRSLSLDVFKWLAKSFRFPKPEINFRILLATSPNRENEKKSPKIASKCKIGHGVGGWRRVSHCHHLFFHNQCPRMDEADSIFLMSTLIGLRLFTRSNPKKHLVAQSSYVIFVHFGIKTTKSRIGTSSKNGSST